MNEFEIIGRYFKNLTADDPRVIYGIGDDAAVLDVPEGYELVVSVDTLVSGIHFTRDVDPRDLGFKALAVNLSDLAAMGAEPGWATLALTIPDKNISWIEGFASGFSELATRYTVALIGGDLTHGPLSVTVQIMGLVPSGTAIRRDGAGIGDDIYISGYPGEAGYALLVDKGEIIRSAMDDGHCRDRLLRPIPRLDLGSGIRTLASAAIDVSDGLAADLGHILSSSSVGARIELTRIPLRQPLAGLSDGNRLWDVILPSGDDYELCFSAPVGMRRRINNIAAGMDYPVTRIGSIVAGDGIRFILEDGSEYLLKRHGYEHF